MVQASCHRSTQQPVVCCGNLFSVKRWWSEQCKVSGVLLESSWPHRARGQLSKASSSLRFLLFLRFRERKREWVREGWKGGKKNEWGSVTADCLTGLLKDKGFSKRHNMIHIWLAADCVLTFTLPLSAKYWKDKVGPFLFAVKWSPKMALIVILNDCAPHDHQVETLLS